jgi:DNA-binding NarL/FixJ family response regulator
LLFSWEAVEAMRVLLADDNVRFRQHIREFLTFEPNIEIVGEASDGREAVSKTLELQPDVVLMDVRMAGIDGLSATREIKANLPETIVVILSRFDLQEYREAALESGATDYVVKRNLFESLIPTIKAVCASSAPESPTGGR